MKYFLILISLLALKTQAVTIETATKRKVAQDNLSSEKELLVAIAACSNGSKVEEMLTCARPLFSEKRTEEQIRKMLFWFRLNIKITDLTVCSDSKVQFIPPRVKLDSDRIICGAYSLEGLDKEALFFIGSNGSDKKLKLINLRP